MEPITIILIIIGLAGYCYSTWYNLHRIDELESKVKELEEKDGLHGSSDIHSDQRDSTQETSQETDK